MDDASLMSEILKRPENILGRKAIGALEELNAKTKEAYLSEARIMAQYANSYHTDDGGTDINEAREVQRLVQQRQNEAKIAEQHAKAMSIFIQKHRQNFGFQY